MSHVSTLSTLNDNVIGNSTPLIPKLKKALASWEASINKTVCILKYGAILDACSSGENNLFYLY